MLFTRAAGTSISRVHKDRRATVIFKLFVAREYTTSTYSNSTGSSRGGKRKYTVCLSATDIPFGPAPRMASFSSKSVDLDLQNQDVEVAHEFRSLWQNGNSPKPLLQLMMKLNSTPIARKNKDLSKFIQKHVCSAGLANDELDVIRLALSIIDLIQENDGKKTKNQKVECVHGLVDGLRSGGFIVSHFSQSCHREVREITERMILSGVNRRFSEVSSSVATDMVALYEGTDLSSSYTSLDLYTKLVLFMIQKIVPGLRSVPNDPTLVFPILEDLRDKQLWKPWARLYSIFSTQLSPHIPHMEVLTQLFEAEQYDLCSEVLSHHAPPFLPSDVFHELTLNTVQLMLATEKSDAIGIAEKISTLHGLHSYRIRAVYLKKKMKLHSMCRSGKWRIAVEIASSPEHKIDIFDNLKQQGKYQQAQMAYEHMNLAALGLSPITEEEFLREKALDLYLQFPLDAKDSIIIVNSSESAQDAIDVVLESIKPSDGLFDGFIGVDAEWQASILGQRRSTPYKYNHRNVNHEGASILQMATSTKVIIVDFVALHSKLRSKHWKANHQDKDKLALTKVSELLEIVFCNPRILKVGWGFEQNDSGMLEMTCDGTFKGVFNHSTAIVNLEKIITVLFRGMRERREEEKKIEERRRAHDSCSSSLSGTTLESKDSDAGQEKSIGAELTHEQLGLIAATTKAQPASLSKVCDFFFSKQLDKTEQVSTWNVRPLSKSQIIYASLDAHAPLAVLANILETPPDDLQYVKSLYSSSSADLTSPSLSFDHILAMGGCKRKQITPTPSNVSSNVNGGGAYSTGYRRKDSRGGGRGIN